MSQCSVVLDGVQCERPVLKRGLCRAHYLQQWRGRPFSKPRRFQLSLADTVHDALRHARREGDCLIVEGVTHAGGYAQCHFQGRVRKLGHLVLHLKTGISLTEAREQGLEMCHARECTSRACIAPGHLRWDTRSANCYDRYAS